MLFRNCRCCYSCFSAARYAVNCINQHLLDSLKKLMKNNFIFSPIILIIQLYFKNAIFCWCYVWVYAAFDFCGQIQSTLEFKGCSQQLHLLYSETYPLTVFFILILLRYAFFPDQIYLSDPCQTVSELSTDLTWERERSSTTTFIFLHV